MTARNFTPLGGLRNVSDFKAQLRKLNCALPCDDELLTGSNSPLGGSIDLGEKSIGNRFAIHPMEGWDGTPSGRPSALTLRRWSNFGTSGAKLIWGGEAVAVLAEGRANPNQLCIGDTSHADLAALRETLIAAHRAATGDANDLLIGLQLTHSGRFSRPHEKQKPEPRILYRHPILDPRLHIDSDDATLTDDEIKKIIEAFHRAAKVAHDVGFDFVDIKHCHGYLGHEFLSAHTRPGIYGGSFENRTRFLREVTEGVRAAAAGLEIGVRLSAFDTIPYRADPATSRPHQMGIGVPEPYEHLLPYVWGFAIDSEHPEQYDLAETLRFLALLRGLGIRLINISAGSPYTNPHIQRPALYPPSDGYQPPEDPLIGVGRQLEVARLIKRAFPEMIVVGTGFTYLQQFLPFVAQGALRENWFDAVGLGRMVLSYPQLPLDVLRDGALTHSKLICRTFSDCTTAPRNNLPSGCYPLDDFYKSSEMAGSLKQIKRRARAE
ncbi:MAG: hypothetical protein WKF30_07815 [Pyrinomonadaceae bacterium]